MRDEKRMLRRFVLDIIAVITAFVAMYLALWMGLTAYAAPLPEVFVGTFRNEFAGGDPDGVAQMPETGDVITTPKTVVILGSRWKLRPGFMLKSVESTDKKVVGVTMKKWNAVIKAKKAGKLPV